MPIVNWPCDKIFFISYERKSPTKSVRVSGFVYISDDEQMLLLRRYRYVLIGCLTLSAVFLLCIFHLYTVLFCPSDDPCVNQLFCARPAMTLLYDRVSLLDQGLSLCSKRAAQRGPHQRVIGVSAYQSRRDNWKLLSSIRSYLLQYIILTGSFVSIIIH
jgi:hypothetical protein